MGILDRIRKIFSRSKSSNKDRTSNRVFQRSYEVEHDKHFNIPTSNPRSSNVTGRSSATALHRSNTISGTAQASGASYREPDADFKRTNSCKGLTSPLAGDAVYSAGCENAGYTTANVCNANNYRRKYPRSSDSESKPSSTSHKPAFLSSNKLHGIQSLKVSDHSGRISETFSNSLQSATLEKTTTGLMTRTFKAPACAAVPTSFKRDSTTIPSHKSERMDDSVATNYKPRTFPQLTRTIDVDKVVKAPEASILKTQRTSTVFHPVKESGTQPTPLSRPVHALHTNLSPLPAPSLRYSTRETQLKDYKVTLGNFTFNVQTLPTDKSFKFENVIYHKQWTECRAKIKVDNRMDHPVRIECPHVDFRDTKIKNGYLHFTMNCSATGNISVLIKIGNFAFTKDFKVISVNPCSSYCSDMTIEKINSEEDEFVFRVLIFDVFGKPVPSNSTASCHLDASFQSTENKVVRTVQHIVQGQICYDITVRGKRPWSQDLVVLLNRERISHPREFEFTENECQAIYDINEEDYQRIQQFFKEGHRGITIPLTTGEDDGEFVAYNESSCEIQSKKALTRKLVCKNVRKYDILGEDCAHINNVRRALDLKDRLEVQETDGCAIIVLRNVPTHLHPKCKEVVEHLLRGLYYRRKASEAARVRMEWKDRLLSIEEVLWLDRKTPIFVFCKYFKDFFGDLMNKYNREACNELFKFFNFQRNESEVDLHGLLVADEKMLKSLRLNLLIGSLNQEQIKKILEICRICSKQGRERQTLKKKFRKGEVPENLVKNFIEGGHEDHLKGKSLKDLKHDCFDEDCSLTSCGCNDGNGDVDAIITKCRLESDEAIRKLEEKLDKFNLEKAITNKTPWLEIIVGAGRHSKKNKQNIRPKVEKLLKKRNLTFAPVNKGSLVVTFKPYNGTEPCFGEYFCEKCDRCWKSSKSYVRKYQKCSKCKANCWPVKQREKEKVTKYRRDGSEKRQSRPHQSSLCQRCQELGRPCNKR